MEEEETQNNGGLSSSSSGKNHKKYRKDKPWDTDDIDHWKIEEWKVDYLKGPFLEESSFATLFPKYREKYLREVWPIVTASLEGHGIACELNLVEGSMTVRTTRKTHDPYMILKGRDLIKLLARSIPVQQAVKVLQDGTHCDIIKIGGIVRNKERFVKRRQRLLGPDGATLKALELLTDCYILVQGNTVSCMGDMKGLKQIRKIVVDCMKNIHPVYHVKTLMIKRELAKDPNLATEDWTRFLPNFKKKSTSSRRKPAVIREKKAYTPFPPAQPLSKKDIQIESGEYFLNEQQRELAKKTLKKEAAKTRAKDRQSSRDIEFEAPEEEDFDYGEEKVASSSTKKKSAKKTGSKSKRQFDEDEDNDAVANNEDELPNPKKKKKSLQ